MYFVWTVKLDHQNKKEIFMNNKIPLFASNDSVIYKEILKRKKTKTHHALTIYN